MVHHPNEMVDFAGRRFVFAVAIGTFTNQVIHFGHGQRVAENRPVRAADVAGKAKTKRAAVFVNFEGDRRAAEDMAGITVHHPHVGVHVKPLFVVVTGKLFQRFPRIIDRVQRIFLRFVLPFFLVLVLRIVLLYTRRIEQHNGAQIAGGVRGVYLSPKTVGHQFGHSSRVIDMRMAEDKAIDVFRVEQPFFIESFHGRSFATRLAFFAALIKAAIEQNAKVIVEGDQVAGAGYFACRSTEFDFHSCRITL